MCLSSAGQIEHVEGDDAVVDVDGRRRRISLAMLVLEGVPVAAGDWVLIHTGFAMDRLDPDDAADLIRLRREMTDTDPEVRP